MACDNILCIIDKGKTDKGGSVGVEAELGKKDEKGNSVSLNFTYLQTYTLPEGCKHL